MNLDNQKLYEKLDPHFVGKSIEYLPDQMRQVLAESRLIKIPREYSQVTQVVVCGMGGSNLGTHFTRSAWSDQIKVPITIIPDYHLPAHVNKNTLVLLSSYSGTTEEVLAAAKEAKKKKAKLAAISENSPKSKLLKLMLKDDIPGYIFKPEYNPSGQPRLGLGYSIFGQAVILAKAGLFKIKVDEIEAIINKLELWTRKLRANVPTRSNQAKKLALLINKKTPILISAEHLKGNTHIIRNQINESSKNFATYLELSDMNHYTMEGLKYPVNNKKNLIALFFDSLLYDKRIQKRSQLTRQVIKKNKIPVVSHQLKAKNKLTQAFELLQLGAWLSYYMGILNQVDPVKIPYVDWFKEQLKK